MKKWVISVFIISMANLYSPISFAEELAPVSGFAREIMTGKPLSDATITILETGRKITTNSQGEYGPFYYPVGKSITLILEKAGYVPTQSATLQVPKEGLISEYTHITFQMLPLDLFSKTSQLINANFLADHCHVATTVLAYHKTMNDLPQGEEDAKVVIEPNVNPSPFYFDIFKDGKYKDQTNPYSLHLTKTSRDGGVLFFNIPVRPTPYTLTAEKAGKVFTKVSFLCRPNSFINISPPLGPMANK